MLVKFLASLFPDTGQVCRTEVVGRGEVGGLTQLNSQRLEREEARGLGRALGLIVIISLSSTARGWRERRHGDWAEPWTSS